MLGVRAPVLDPRLRPAVENNFSIRINPCSKPRFQNLRKSKNAREDLHGVLCRLCRRCRRRRMSPLPSEGLDRATAGSDRVADMQAMEHWKTAVK